MPTQWYSEGFLSFHTSTTGEGLMAQFSTHFKYTRHLSCAQQENNPLTITRSYLVFELDMLGGALNVIHVSPGCQGFRLSGLDLYATAPLAFLSCRKKCCIYQKHCCTMITITKPQRIQLFVS